MGLRFERDITRYMYEQPDHYTVRDAFIAYSQERLIARGKDCRHAWCAFNFFMDIVPPQQEPSAITTGQIEDFVDYRMTRCTSLLTPRRELTFVKTAIRNAHRRNRIASMPYIELPEGQSKYRRPLTDPEFRLVMSKPMSGRLRRFYWLSYYTGHRPHAVEEARWSLFDWKKLTLDFNIPGRIITNKRRSHAFPMPDEFLPRLRAWKETAKDDYIIGLGPRGALSSTYREADYVVRELCGLTDPTLVPRHCMRKMYATECFERQMDPEVVGFLMADDPKTLRRNYVTFKDSTLRDAANLRTRPLIVVQRELAPAAA